MLETIIMTCSLVILGYAFYISSRLFWIYKSDSGYRRYAYSIISLFIGATYFLFAFVLFAFITEIMTSFSMINLVNIVLSIFLLSGAGLIGVLMKHYISTIKSSIMNNIQKEVQKWAEKKHSELSGEQKSKVEMQKEIDKLNNELDTVKSINRFAIGKDIQIIDLKKKIEQSHKKSGSKK